MLNLPPSWKSGYALPRNVRSEPPRRSLLPGGYSTPRGFYDNARPVAAWNPGYVLPASVARERPGQAPKTTKQLPRRTVTTVLPELVPGAIESVEDEFAVTPAWNTYTGSQWLDQAAARYGFGDDGLGVDVPGLPKESIEPLVEYGNRVADAVLRGAASVPPSQRAAVIRHSFDQLEPGLYSRVNARMKSYQQQGLRPQQALRAATSVEASRGLVNEVLDIRRKGPAAVRRTSRVGLAGWGCPTAMGAVSAVLEGPNRTPVTSLVDPMMRRCGPFYVYRGASWNFGAPPPSLASGRSFATGALPTTYLGAMGVPEGKEGHIVPAEQCFKMFPELRQLWELGKAADRRKYGLAAPQNSNNLLNGKAPFAEISSGSGQDLRLYFLMQGRVPGVDTGDMIAVRVKPRGRKWYEKAWDWTRELGLTFATGGLYLVWKFRDEIADAVGDVLEAVGDITCKVLNDPNGQLAIGVGAGAAGAPPQAGMTGAQIAAGLCNQGQQGAPPPVAEEPSLLMPALLVGGGLLAVVAFMSHKKKG